MHRFAKAEMFNQLFADCKWQSFRGVFVDTKCDETNCESPASCSGAGHCTPKGTCACDRGAIGDLCEDCVTGFAGTSCDACAPGFHGLTCQQCPLNTYSAGGAPTDAVCEACAPGTSRAGVASEAGVASTPRPWTWIVSGRVDAAVLDVESLIRRRGPRRRESDTPPRS